MKCITHSLITFSVEKEKAIEQLSVRDGGIAWRELFCKEAYYTRDPVKTSFEEWARPGHFSRTISKGPDTTTWIWNLHVNAHDFDSHTSDLEEISRKVFNAHFSQLSNIFLWLSGMYFHGARFSNYEAWLSDPSHIGPSAQIWRASRITSELQLYCTAIGALVFAALMLFADAGVDPKEIPLPHEFLLNRDLLAQLYPSFAEGATPFFTLNWSKDAEFLTFRGGLDLVTGGLWLTDIAHHHLAIAILFLIVSHMYRTNWGIGHGLKDILEAHKGPFIGRGYKGLYEILTMSWHAQLSLNLAMLGSLTIVVATICIPCPLSISSYRLWYTTFVVHDHMWIGGFLIVGAFDAAILCGGIQLACALMKISALTESGGQRFLILLPFCHSLHLSAQMVDLAIKLGDSILECFLSNSRRRQRATAIIKLGHGAIRRELAE
ncbi:hypothetical protein IFM89_020239 [Coptis chinensis]|uniref:Uncharacterized protein n=1 Tax=Coptis chinensis TaxID=261450 RepID=A0A835HNB2_9MAGN|nr:hypothetical protein IFM89_020239 [Coptis chinensis]